LERLRPEYYSTSSATAIDAWYLSSLLYALLALRRKGKTLGMDAVGLDYAGEKSFSPRRTIVLQSVGGVTLIYLFHRLAWLRTQSDTVDLRGLQRRQAHERQRRAMIARSQRHSSPGSVPTSSSDQGGDGALLMARHIPEKLRQYCHTLVDALTAFQTGGPHDLAAQQIISPAWWCLRLYSAYYCLNGVFPSLGHWLFGLRPAAGANQNRLVNCPESHRLVALLILSHATGVALQTLSKATMGLLIKNRRSRPGAVRLQGQDTGSESKPSGLCAICQQSRKNPACPVQCGHIFCWTCLQKWMKFRAECPVCRKASRPQDILALHNYLAPSEILDEGGRQR
jgi:hypothetical protein